MDNVNALIKLVKTYFDNNVTGFIVTPDENEQDFSIECLVYRSFLVNFTLGDVRKGGVFGIGVATGGRMFSLDILTQNEEDLPIDFREDAINQNLKILDYYLQWRMTDAQKKTFNLI